MASQAEPLSPRAGRRAAPRLRRNAPLGLLALVLTLFAWAPLLTPDYFIGAHDAYHALFFPFQFALGLRDGFWLPRWGSDIAFGYGYPLYVFYAPLAFYLWSGFWLTGLFGVVASTKATFVAGFLLAAAGTYAYARDLWGRAAGLLAATVYTYLPYHLVNVYVRAAVAEFVAMGIMPWCLLAFRRLIRHPSPGTVAAAAASYGALLMTHNASAVLFTPLLGVTIVWELAMLRVTRGASFGAGPLLRHLGGVIAGGLLGIALGTTILLPSLSEQADIRVEQWAQTYLYVDHFIAPHQLLGTAWGYGHSQAGTDDGMPLQLGLVPLVLGVLGVLGPTLVPGGRQPNRATVLFYGVALGILVVLLLPVSSAIWGLSPLSTLIQFPWRLLGVAGLVVALLAGSAAPLLHAGQGVAAPGLVVAILLVIMPASVYAQPQPTPTDGRYETTQFWRDFEASYPDMVGMVALAREQPNDSPMREALEANQMPQRFQPLTPGTTLTQRHSGAGSASADVVVPAGGTTLRFLSYWYPGWEARLDGQPIPLRPDGGPYGLILMDLPEGSHRLELRFVDTPMRRTANLISLASLLLLGALSLHAAGVRLPWKGR